MRKIVLICAAGMSTSLLVTKMRSAAAEEDYECQIDAYPMGEMNTAVDGADIVLLGPQVRFNLEKVRAAASCPVEPIEMSAYGRMDGEAILEFAQEVLGD